MLRRRKQLQPLVVVEGALVAQEVVYILARAPVCKLAQALVVYILAQVPVCILALALGLVQPSVV